MSVRLSEHPSKSFEILHEPQSNILLYRYIPANLRKKDRSEWISPETTLILNRYVERIQNQVAAIQDSRPHAFTSRTTVLYHDLLTSCFRIVISNPLTQWQNIVDGIENQLVVAQSVEREFEVEEMMRRVMTAYPGMESGDALQGWSGWPFDI
jgi:glutamate decarboxylase